MSPKKFRAWDIKRKYMIGPDDCPEVNPKNCGNLIHCDMETIGIGLGGALYLIDECGNYEYAHRGHYILEQYTGLHDKKRTKKFPEGQPIYEGDILKDDSSEILIVKFGKLPLDKSGDCVCTYLAFYCEDKGGLGYAPSYECREIGDWMEVIGNIHTDKETQ